MNRIAFVPFVLLCVLVACTQQPPRPPATVAELQKVTDAKSPHEIGTYIFNHYGCKNCHSLSSAGKFGYTAAGEQLKTKSEGCVAMLTSIHRIVSLPETNRTDEHRTKLAHFNEYGCTACHQISLGTVGLTEVGANLKELHMACTDVQKIVN